MSALTGGLVLVPGTWHGATDDLEPRVLTDKCSSFSLGSLSESTTRSRTPGRVPSLTGVLVLVSGRVPSRGGEHDPRLRTHGRRRHL